MIDTTTKTAITVSSILTGIILIVTGISILIAYGSYFDGLSAELICLGSMNLFVGIWFFIYWISIEGREEKKDEKND